MLSMLPIPRDLGNRWLFIAFSAFFTPPQQLCWNISHIPYISPNWSVWSSVFTYATVICNCHHSEFENFFFFLLSKRNPISFSCHPPPSSSSHLPALCNHWSASCLHTLLYSGRLHEWRHIRGLLGLAPFTSRVSKIHPSYSMCRDLIPFYGCIMLHPVDVPRLHPAVSWCTFEWFLPFGHYE